MISHEHKCIFIHIPKAAGSSIEKKLGHFTELKRGVQDHRGLKIIQPKGIFQTMGLALSLLNQGFKKDAFHTVRNFEKPALSKAQYADYYKFTFVRNPWTRAYSWYKNVMDDEVHQTKLKVDGTISFRDFLTRQIGKGPLRSQLYWIEDLKGSLPYDFIGRFESLHADFAKVANAVGIGDPALPQVLVGKKETYWDYFDSETKDAIYKYYRREIEIFDFEYGE